MLTTYGKELLRLGTIHSTLLDQGPKGCIVKVVNVAYKELVSRLFGNATDLTINLPPAHVISQILNARVAYRPPVETG